VVADQLLLARPAPLRIRVSRCVSRLAEVGAEVETAPAPPAREEAAISADPPASHDPAASGADRLPEELRTAPALDGLVDAAREVLELSAALSAARDGWVNREGGDVGGSGSRRSLLRHVANYLAAAELAGRRAPVTRVVDVGGGVGALGVWLARRLGAQLVLVDADPQVRAVARRAFPQVQHCAGPDDLDAGSADLVTAMEVVEHVPPTEQRAFVRDLARLVAPGGMLVLSTPDESRYLGGWSGYAPHVGVLDAHELHHLVAGTTGLPAAVWRLEGDVFALRPWERVLLPVANRVWGRAAQLPPVTAAGHAVGSALGRLRGWSEPAQRPLRLHGSARAVPAGSGEGTGLLAVAARR
jgi:SAM-dependent methyltransferase